MAEGKLKVTIEFDGYDPVVIERDVVSWRMEVLNNPIGIEVDAKKEYLPFEGSLNVDWRLKR